ncbi:RNA-directed DNA polymerase [Chitinophaga silvatica]|uniref:RNA-directed DNA polymerase n=1 Tax=Chitinophaga silvatica TaxID=2282649 RepID=A0A3E1YC68_9BACT|nr:reverse transcriptase family protein [Chitinophaga silvatica]RFS23927.1 RNA-directed DNA polymerase [Chitinophaga silvatica]
MIKSLRHLEAVIGYKLKDIDAVLDNLHKYYNSFSRTKKSGKKRDIDSSENILRDLHNRINDRIFSQISLPYHVTGSVKYRSAVLNAKYHSGKKYHFQTDLVGYFQFVSNRLVYSTLVSFGFSADVASYITKITTYKGHVPQGVPTSPFLCNVVGLRILDGEILEFCKSRSIIYTRYIDDLTFSSDVDIKDFIPDILQIINNKNFLYSHRKTIYKAGDIVVTGVLTTCNGLKMPERLIEKMSNEVDIIKRKGYENFANQIQRIHKLGTLNAIVDRQRELVFPGRLKDRKKKNASSAVLDLVSLENKKLEIEREINLY